MGHLGRSKDELMSDSLLWTPADEYASVGWPVKPYLHQHRMDTRLSLKDMIGVIDAKRESEKSLLLVQLADENREKIMQKLICVTTYTEQH